MRKTAVVTGLAAGWLDRPAAQEIVGRQFEQEAGHAVGVRLTVDEAAEMAHRLAERARVVAELADSIGMGDAQDYALGYAQGVERAAYLVGLTAPSSRGR